MKERVRELRAQGLSPKQIARELKVAPSVVAPLVRAVAAEGGTNEGESELVGCWMNVGWSVGLGVDPARGWADEAPDAETGGLVSVLVARKHGWDKVKVTGYLADVYCLGVKNTVGPDVLNERELRRFREFVFGEYQGWQEVPLELAQHLVLGSVEYAKGLGFEPREEFWPVAEQLGTWQGPSAITFGRDGKPFFVQGPDDEGIKVVRILQRTLSDDQFDYVLTDPSPAS
ncbi:helix-turn-helix domain-containing protein [Nonomuraea sp. NN258]|nr:helix-turn-helix domain-containing protein [Nonomuraea antri]